MHELGIVFYVVDAVEKVAEDNGAERVVECTLELGEVSSVITSYFLDLWNWEIRKHEKLKDCKINIVPLKAISFCEDCEKTYETVQHGKVCPHCGSKRTYLVTGREINLRNIVVT